MVVSMKLHVADLIRDKQSLHTPQLYSTATTESILNVLFVNAMFTTTHEDADTIIIQQVARVEAGTVLLIADYSTKRIQPARGWCAAVGGTVQIVSTSPEARPPLLGSCMTGGVPAPCGRH